MPHTHLNLRSTNYKYPQRLPCSQVVVGHSLHLGDKGNGPNFSYPYRPTDDTKGYRPLL